MVKEEYLYTVVIYIIDVKNRQVPKSSTVDDVSDDNNSNIIRIIILS